MKNSFAGLVPDLPASSSLGLPVSATAALTPAVLTRTGASSSSLPPFPLSESDGSLPAVGGLDLLPGAGGVHSPSRGPVTSSINYVSGRNGQISPFSSPAAVLDS
jgi:hypothetical protein